MTKQQEENMNNRNKQGIEFTVSRSGVIRTSVDALKQSEGLKTQINAIKIFRETRKKTVSG
jgi:hypothetical protein